MGEVSLPRTGPSVPVSLLSPLVLQIATGPTALTTLLGAQGHHGNPPYLSQPLL